MVTGARGPVAAIGNFDGVHLGHQFLLAETRKIAEAAGAPTGAVVFDPHPRRYFRPDDPPFLLTTAADRARLLKAHGAETVMTLTFDSGLAALSPEDFVRKILRERLGLSGVVSGSEFHFGKGRAGDVDALARLAVAAGISAHRVAPLPADDGGIEKIGSSAVRAALKSGDVAEAERLLGRRWSVSGTVAEGRRLGRTIGFPTANLDLGELIEPRYGVYAVSVTHGARAYPGVANFGLKPTVGAPRPLLEAHLLDFQGDLYGETIEVAFAAFIRPETKFQSIDELKAQIGCDVETARGYFASA